MGLRRWGIPALMLWISALLMAMPGVVSVGAQPAQSVVLEDFRSTDSDGFPNGWKAQRSETKVRETYTVHSEKDLSFLTAKSADQRVKKKMSWDPKATPIVTWRWRVKEVPEGADLLAAVYLSLDTDLIFIPVATKYVWSATKAKGTVTEGGLFGATEIVLRTGSDPVGEWVEEQVNAYEDFKRIHKHEPAPQAWGISLLGGPDVEVDFGAITTTGE
jgi:hypothetical protein